MQRGGTPWYNIGLDETNNGLSPILYAAVFSNNRADVKYHPEKILEKCREHKESSDLKNPSLLKLADKDYRFLFWDDAHKILIPSFKKWGIIISSLIYGEPTHRSLNLYLDGNLGDIDTDFTKHVLNETTGILKKKIRIISGPSLDERIELVNLSDQTAHWLATKSLTELSKNRRKRSVRYKELLKYIK